MYSLENISTQIPIPAPLYNADSECAAIVQHVHTQVHSINHEILGLLSTSLEMDALHPEITAWEAASDEDWLNLEMRKLEHALCTL